MMYPLLEVIESAFCYTNFPVRKQMNLCYIPGPLADATQKIQGKFISMCKAAANFICNV